MVCPYCPSHIRRRQMVGAALAWAVNTLIIVGIIAGVFALFYTAGLFK